MWFVNYNLVSPKFSWSCRCVYELHNNLRRECKKSNNSFMRVNYRFNHPSNLAKQHQNVFEISTKISIHECLSTNQPNKMQYYIM